MKFAKFATYIEQIEKTSSRLTITHLLAELFKRLTPEEIDKAVYLLSGRVAPLFEAVEFGMAEKMVLKSVAVALNIERKFIESEYKKIGDLGLTIEHFKKQKNTLGFEEKDLTIVEVFERLKTLALSSGTGSHETKTNILAELIRCLDGISCRYIVRIPTGTMRLGFSDMTVLDALSWMVKGDKSLRPAIEHAYHVRPDLGFISRLVKEHEEQGLKKIVPVVGTPILMMKAERLSSGVEIIEKIGECSVEPKYDGFRLQVHYKKGSRGKGEVRLFTRNLEDASSMYPDLIEAVNKQIKGNDIIFEGEAIGFDPISGNFLPFQETVQRKRKYNIEEVAKKIPLKLFAFELLYLNGKSYLEVPFSERRKILKKIIPISSSASHSIVIAPDEIIKDGKKLELLFDDAISRGLEGIIAKKLSGMYQPGARGWNWIKFKRSYSSHIDDTIDCLVMGFDSGKGKRTSFGIGAFLVGILDQKQDKFLTVAKIGTGLTDEEWRKLKVKSEKLKIQNKPKQYNVDKMMECDVWVSPSIVVEIKADEITRSPVHTAGRTLKTSKSGSSYEVDIPGYALRFPRLVNFRDDKRPEDVTTLKEVEKLLKSQKK